MTTLPRCVAAIRRSAVGDGMEFRAKIMCSCCLIEQETQVELLWQEGGRLVLLLRDKGPEQKPPAIISLTLPEIVQTAVEEVVRTTRTAKGSKRGG